MDVQSVATVKDLRQLAGAEGQTIILECYAQPGDGGGGIFTYIHSHTAVDDGGTIFKFDVPSDPILDGAWHRMYAGPLNALWFGLDFTGSTPNDSAHSKMLESSAAGKSPGFFYPAGTYLFEKTIGPWPLGARVFGSGISILGNPHVNDQGGTVFHFSGSGVAVELGHDPDVNTRNGSVFEGIEVLGVNPNGATSYPNINEIGIEILNDGSVTVRNCRVGGFKFSISLDGAEVCAVEGCNFDGAPPVGKGYPVSDLSTDLVPQSAFAIRLGTWKSQAGLACNQIVISNCQFNNTYWGVLHNGGFNHHVVDCNFESNVAILTEANFATLYENITGEGAFNSNFLTTGTNYHLTLKNVVVTQSCPLLTLLGPQIGLNLLGNYLQGSTCPFPVVGSRFVAGGSTLGNIGPVGAGEGTAGVIFDTDPLSIVELNYAYSKSNPALGINCTPLSPIDINDNRLRIRNSHTPSSSADAFGNVGDICWDANYMYVKTHAGWARSPLTVW